MSENTELIRKILKSKDLTEQEKVDIIRKIVEDKTVIYPTYPIYPDTTPCPYTYPIVTFTSDTNMTPNVTGTAICYTG